VRSRGIGVSDGVGSWARYGISASAFANELMDHCCNALDQFLGRDDEGRVISQHSFPKTTSAHDLFSNRGTQKWKKQSSKYLSKK